MKLHFEKTLWESALFLVSPSCLLGRISTSFHLQAWFAWLKAALINIFILTVDQMTMCNVKGVACSDEPTENYHSNLQFPPALQTVLAFFTAANCFSLTAWKTYCLVQSHRSHQPCFQQRTAVLGEKALINLLYATIPVPTAVNSSQTK